MKKRIGRGLLSKAKEYLLKANDYAKKTKILSQVGAAALPLLPAQYRVPGLLAVHTLANAGYGMKSIDRIKRIQPVRRMRPLGMGKKMRRGCGVTYPVAGNVANPYPNNASLLGVPKF